MEEMIIAMEHVTKTYPKFVLEDVSLQIPAGCIVGLIGENGAGKTTMIKLMLNMIRPDEGKITIFGRDHQQEEKTIKEDLGVVLGELNLPDSFTAAMAGSVMACTYPDWDRPLFDRFLERFGLEKKQKIKAYSRGMKMKLAIALAMSHHARLLILDEPTSGLDPVVRDEILELLQEQIQDESCSVLLSSHIMSDLEKISDYIAYVKNGRLILFEEKDGLLDRLGILRCSHAEWSRMDHCAAWGFKENSMGVEALVERARVPASAVLERATLEDVMTHYGRGREQ